MLSNIEHSKANPTVVILHKIAAALQCSLIDLIEEPSPERYFAIVNAECPADPSGRDIRRSAKRLTPLQLENEVQAFDVELPGQTCRRVPAFETGTLALATVMVGRVEVSIEGDKRCLVAGDSATYRADCEHLVANPDCEPARILLFFSMPTLH